MEYSKYQISLIEYLLMGALALVISAIVSYLFYDNLWGMLLSPILVYFLKKIYRTRKIKAREDKLLEEFIDTLKSISAALMAGYSMENAFKEAQKEIMMLHGEKSLMYRELQEINNSIQMNVPIENLVSEFATRTQLDEIISFADIFAFAKRSGGNYRQIIESTTYRISSKYETQKEIAVTIASKKLEQKIMDIIPIGIIAYLRLTSADYLALLYEGLFGRIFMTACIAVYIFALYLSEKIMDISI